MAYIVSKNEQKIIDSIPVPQYYNEQIVPNKGGFRLISPERPSGICPFHSDTDPSLHYYKDSNMFKCFGCGKAGSVVTMHMLWMKEYNGKTISKNDAIKELAIMYNIELELDETGEVVEESIFDSAKRMLDRTQYDVNVFDMNNLTIAGFRTFNNQIKDRIEKMPYISGEQAANLFYKLDLTLSSHLADKKAGSK